VTEKQSHDAQSSFSAPLLPLVDLADAHLARMIPLMQPIMMDAGISLGQRQTLAWLSTAALRASGSVFVLLSFDRVWDAEIVCRSVFDATLKFCHLLADPSKLETRLWEYESVLPDISALADHQKVKRLIDAMPDISEEVLTPLRELLLTEERGAEIAGQYPRDVRRRLQTSWGFTGLIDHMVRSNEGLGKLAAGLLHGYSMASHIAHADYQGAGMVMEREYRDHRRRDAANKAHGARLISDQLWYCALRLIVSYRFLGRSTQIIYDLMNEENDLFRELHAAQQEWISIEYTC